MAEMTIRLQIDPATGKKDIIVSLRSDDDALPHEHEQQHRALVDRLIEGGIVKAGEVGKVIVEREEESPQGQSTPESGPQDERRSQSEGA
jgi:FtsH ternary system domain X3-analog